MDNKTWKDFSYTNCWIVSFFILFLAIVFFGVFTIKMTDTLLINPLQDRLVYDNIDANISRAIVENNASKKEIIQLINNECANAILNGKFVQQWKLSECTAIEYQKFFNLKQEINIYGNP